MNPTHPGTRGHLLIADDEASVRHTLNSVLSAAGFTCICVADGTEALARLSEGVFDAFISDLQMPGNEGLSLFESVSKHVPNLPIVLLTGNPTVATAAGSLRLPVIAYLTKPPDFEALTQILDTAVANYRALRTMHAGHQRLLDWEHELELILKQNRVPKSLPDGQMGSYLRLTLRHVILVLGDLENSIRELEQQPKVRSALLNQEREAALRRAVDVLQRTKQSFKSRELGELRKELVQLLNRDAEGDVIAATST